MKLKNKRIGIWGHGAVGRSAVRFFQARSDNNISVCDQQAASTQLNELARLHNIAVYDQETQLTKFLDECNYILASPGIDLRNHAEYSHKWICEADIFAAHWQKPVIAITGTLGKTTVTHLLAQQLSLNGLNVVTGGNIGTPMLDLIATHDSYNIAVLELSSFQLEYVKSFAPDVAIITNVYPNHLDRHTDFSTYLSIKKNIFRHQTPDQIALLPAELYQRSEIPNPIYFFSSSHISLPIGCDLYYLNEQDLVVKKKDERNLITSRQIPADSFKENWLIVAAALDQLNLSLKATSIPITLPHRLEKVATINGITFYNDSKSTVIESTLSAVNSLKNQPIILLLGGTSKGVDRLGHLHRLPANVKHVMCFGAEAQALNEACISNNISSSSHPDLAAAFAHAVKSAHSGDSILLSPSGASYDLYKNYEERGEHFKTLVSTLDVKNEYFSPKSYS